MQVAIKMEKKKNISMTMAEKKGFQIFVNTNMFSKRLKKLHLITICWVSRSIAITQVPGKEDYQFLFCLICDDLD